MITIHRKCEWLQKFEDLPVITPAEYLGAWQYSERGDHGEGYAAEQLVSLAVTMDCIHYLSVWKGKWKTEKYKAGQVIEVQPHHFRFAETEDEYLERVKKFYAELKT